MRSTYVVNVIDILVGCSKEHYNVFQVDLLVVVLVNLSEDLLQQDYSLHALWRRESLIFKVNCHCLCHGGHLVLLHLVFRGHAGRGRNGAPEVSLPHQVVITPASSGPLLTSSSL